MGKSLIIKGADFSSVAVCQLDFNQLEMYITPAGFSTSACENPSKSWGIRTQNAFISSGTKVAVFDVGNYAGKTIQIYYTLRSLSNDGNDKRSWIYFSRDLGSTSLDDLANLEPYDSDTPRDIKVTVDSLIELSPYTVETQPTTKTVVVPSTARYLLFPVPIGTGCVSESDIRVTVID